jgi:hypothetical protein
VTVLTFSSTGRTAATTYYYKVTAVNSAGSSVGSTEATATTSAAVSGGGSTAGTLSVSTLKWDDGAILAILQKSMTDAVVGTVVEIAGTGFEDGKMQVTFGGGKIAPVQYVSATKIRAKIPLDATNGAVTVLHTGSQASVVSATSITIDPTSCGSTSLASVASTTVPFVAAAPSLGSNWVNCGASWYQQNLSLGQQIIWDGSQFINEYGGTSPNGYAWSRGTATTQYATDAQIFSLASNGSVVVGIDRSQGVNQILYGKYLPGFSALTWAVPTLPSVVGAYEVQSVSQANGIFFVTTNSNAVVKSPDGINWTSTQDYLGTVQWNGTKYVGFNAISATSTNPTACASTDATTWSCSAIKQSVGSGAPVGIDLSSIAFDGTNYFAMASNAGAASMWKSADGITWTKFAITVSGVAASVTFKKLMWAGNQFIAIGQDSIYGIGSRMLTSVDGITWVGTDLSTTTVTPSMTSIAYSPTLKRAVIGGRSSGSNASDQRFVRQ